MGRINILKVMQDIESLSFDELNIKLISDEAKIVEIESKLREAKAKKHATGEWADSDWFNRASHMLKLTKLNVSLMQRRLKTLKRVHSATTTCSFERKFMDIAKRKLKDDVYSDLISETKEEMEACQ